MIYGYARILTGVGTLDRQIDALSAAGASEIFSDGPNHGQVRAPGLRQALLALAPGDTLLVTRLDRLASSTADLLRVLHRITARQANFRSLTEPWADTMQAKASGGMMAMVIRGLVDFETEAIRSRTEAGRAKAAERGVKLGRKFKLTETQRQDALARLDAGEQATPIALSYDVAVSTITRLHRAALVKERAGGPASLLDADTARAARSFLRRIARKYRPVDAVVYGSRARGTHRPDSDADLAVILNGPPGDRAGISMDMAGVAVDVLDETGILISPLPLWATEFTRPDRFSNPALIEAIRREGLRL